MVNFERVTQDIEYDAVHKPRIMYTIDVVSRNRPTLRLTFVPYHHSPGLRHDGSCRPRAARSPNLHFR